MLLNASDFMWHLFPPCNVCVVEVFLETVFDYSAKQQSIFRVNPTENGYLLPCCLHCVSMWLRNPDIHWIDQIIQLLVERADKGLSTAVIIVIVSQ